jgi:hypothetical protein
MEILNLPVMKNPLNWFIVLFMVVIAGLGFHFLIKIFQSSGPTSGLANPISTNDGV